MSLRATLWVLDGAAHITDPIEVLVLVALADGADDGGQGARLSVATIAGRARVDRRTAQRVLARLEERGQLAIERSDGGRGKWSTYNLLLADPANGGTVPPIPEAETAALQRQYSGTAVPPSNDGPDPELPPQPPASGGRDATHRGQHSSCRACGTNRRGPAPEDAGHAARSAAISEPDRRAANPCRQCAGDKLVDALGGTVVQCPRCHGTGIEPSRRVS